MDSGTLQMVKFGKRASIISVKCLDFECECRKRKHGLIYPFDYYDKTHHERRSALYPFKPAKKIARDSFKVSLVRPGTSKDITDILLP